MIEPLLAVLPPESHDAIRELWEAPLDPVEELRSEVRAYTAGVRVLARSQSTVDSETADQISQICTALLDTVGEDAHRHRLVQVACQYYTMTFDDDDDESGDLGEDGFSDDLVVARAIAELLA